MYKTANIFLVVIIALAVGAASYFIGMEQGSQKTESHLMSIVDMAYPPPPEVINSVGGVVVDVQGATIDMKIVDPDDYLPHPDGSPHEKIMRFANVGTNTQITHIDYNNPQPNGRPTKTEIELSDIKKENTVRVTSNENIKEQKSFDVTKVEVIET